MGWKMRSRALAIASERREAGGCVTRALSCGESATAARARLLFPSASPRCWCGGCTCCTAARCTTTCLGGHRHGPRARGRRQRRHWGTAAARMWSGWSGSVGATQRATTIPCATRSWRSADRLCRSRCELGHGCRDRPQQQLVQSDGERPCLCGRSSAVQGRCSQGAACSCCCCQFGEGAWNCDRRSCPSS